MDLTGPRIDRDDARFGQHDAAPTDIHERVAVPRSTAISRPPKPVMYVKTPIGKEVGESGGRGGEFGRQQRQTSSVQSASVLDERRSGAANWLMAQIRC